MSEQVILHARDADLDRIEWLVQAAGVPDAVQSGRLEDAAGHCRDRRVTLIVPGMEVSATRVHLQVRKVRDLIQAIPYALEDQLADDVEDLHFTNGQKSEDDVVPVIVVAKARMSAWIARLDEAGIEAEAIVPDFLTVPYMSDSWCIVCEEGRVLNRRGVWDGGTLETPTFLDWCRVADRPHEDPITVKIWSREGQDLDEIMEALTEAGFAPVLQVPYDGLLALMMGIGSAPVPVNLRHGPYRLVHKSSVTGRQRRSASALLFIAVAVHAGFTARDHYQLSEERKKLSVANEAIFRSTFPKVERLVDLRAQASQALAALRTRNAGLGTGFLDHLHGGGEPIASGIALRMEGLSYRDGYLDVDLGARELSQLEQYQRRLKEAGTMVEVLSVDSRQDGVRGRLRLRIRQP